MSPALPLRPCLESARGCRALVSGGGRCPAHAKERDRIEWAEHGSSSSRGYGQSWRGLRAAVLLDEPLCRAHLTGRLDLGRGAWLEVALRTEPASVVDHVLARELGGGEERANLQPLCRDCNAVKTAEDHRRIAARKLGLSK